MSLCCIIIDDCLGNKTKQNFICQVYLGKVTPFHITSIICGFILLRETVLLESQKKKALYINLLIEPLHNYFLFMSFLLIHSCFFWGILTLCSDVRKATCKIQSPDTMAVKWPKVLSGKCHHVPTSVSLNALEPWGHCLGRSRGVGSAFMNRD